MITTAMNMSPHTLHLLFFFIFFSIAVYPTSSAASFELLSASHLNRYHQLRLAKVTGPESIAFDCEGRGPYVGVSDGRILKWEGPRLGWKEFAVPVRNRNRRLCDGSTDPDMEQTCGRPLGLKFSSVTCELYVADAYYGLLKVGRDGGVAQQLATSGGGVPFNLTNALDIDTSTGAVYFTDSTTFYQRRNYMLSIETGDKTGRVLKYDPHTKRVTVLLKGLSFPNGVALSKDASCLVVVETGNFQLLRVWLRGPKSQSPPEVFFSQLGRYPDNIKRNDKGEFWVALNSGRSLTLPKMGVDRADSLSVKGNGGNGDAIPWFTKDPVAIKFSEEGTVLEVMDGEFGKRFESVSEVEEYGGTLWIGSVTKPYVGEFKAN